MQAVSSIQQNKNPNTKQKLSLIETYSVAKIPKINQTKGKKLKTQERILNTLSININSLFFFYPSELSASISIIGDDILF